VGTGPCATSAGAVAEGVIRALATVRVEATDAPAVADPATDSTMLKVTTTRLTKVSFRIGAHYTSET
jgi:hypothetical protein